MKKSIFKNRAIKTLAVLGVISIFSLFGFASAFGYGGGGGGGFINTDPPAAPSTGFKVIINDGQAKTGNRQVKLTLDGGNEALFMAISNDANFTGANREDYSTAKDWTLSEGNGLKTVYAKFYSQNGFATAVISDDIILGAGGVVPQVLGIKIYNFTRNLGQGSRGADVKELQLFLIGNNTGPAARALAKIGATSYFGSYTRKALLEFQLLTKGLPHTGYFGNVTRTYLNNLQ